MRVAIAADHAGVDLLEPAIAAVRAAGHESIVVLEATDGDDYPDIALAVGHAIRDGLAERGVVLCGSGAGVTVAANKIPLVRCALAYDTYTARQMVEHDAVNVLALGARVIGTAIAHEVVDAFVGATFSGASRHARRLQKVIAIEATRIAGVPAELRARGQIIWLDGVYAATITDGSLAARIGDQGVTGVALAAAALASAVRDDATYAERIVTHHGRGVTSADELVDRLVADDARMVADLLAVVHASSGGRDGYVVVDLPAGLVDDVDATVAAAVRTARLVARANVMTAVPATRAGLDAIRRLVADGSNVVATMVYSVDQYRAAVDACLDGMRQRVDDERELTGGTVVAVSIASWDTATAERLPAALRDTVGPVIARTVHAEHERVLASSSWGSLAAAGASPPGLLFSNLSAERELPVPWYVEQITASDTRLLVTPATLDALAARDHLPDEAVADDPAATAEALDRVGQAGVALDVLPTRMRHDGLRARAAAWTALVESVVAVAAGTVVGHDARAGDVDPVAEPLG